MLDKMSIVIPVYNNAESLPHLFAALDSVKVRLREDNWTFEEILVDDGSIDNSLQILQDRLTKEKDAILVKLSRNFGAVACSKTGLNFVRGDAFVVIAADLQDPPELILDMAAKWRRGSKFVIAVRSDRGDSLLTRFFSTLHYWLVRRLVIKNYPRGGFDVALMDKSLLGPLRNSSKNTFTPLLAFWLGYPPDVIQYSRPAREHGKSGWSFAKRLSASMDILLGFTPRAMRLLSLFSLVSALISGLLGVYVVLNAFLNRYTIPGFATLVVLISFLFSMTLAMLALIGEYIWRLSIESNKRPDSVIESVWTSDGFLEHGWYRVQTSSGNENLIEGFS